MSAIKIGDTFRYLDADVVVVAVGGPGDAFLVRDGEIGIRALTRADGVKLGWLPVTSGEHEAFRDLAEFLAIAEPTILTAPTNPSTGAVAAPTPAPVGAQTPEPFSVEGMHIVSGWLVEPVNECTCGGADQYGHAAHEPGCGVEPVARLDDLPGWPGELAARPSTADAVAAIKKRLAWASLHWGTKSVHEDAWPHIADAVLNLWDAEANR